MSLWRRGANIYRQHSIGETVFKIIRLNLYEHIPSSSCRMTTSPVLLHGELRVSLDSVRELAIECHALDVAAYPLLWDSTHDDKAARTKLGTNGFLPRSCLVSLSL